MKTVLIFSVVARWDEYVPPMLDSVMGQTYHGVDFHIFTSDHSKKEIEKYLKEHFPEKQTVFYHSAPNLQDPNSIDAFCEKIYSDLIPSYDYFTKIDGDDYIELNYIEKLVTAAEEEQADIACAGRWYHGENQIHTGFSVSKRTVYETKDSMEYFYQFCPFFTTYWGLLFHSSINIKNIQTLIPPVNERGGNGGDTIMGFLLLNQANRIVLVEGAGYHYRLYVDNSANKQFLEGRENVGSLLYSYYMQLLEGYGTPVSQENRNKTIIDCSNSNSYAIKVLLDDGKISPEEKFEKAHFMFTCDMMKEIIAEVPTPIYKNYLRQYDRVLNYFKEGLLELTQEKKEKLYEIFLVLWWRYKGRVSFDVYEEFLFQPLLINSFVNDHELTCAEGILLEIEKREKDLEDFKNQVAKFLDKEK